VLTESQTVQALAALAQPVRLRAFRALVVAGPQGLTPGALAEALGATPSALSFHLKELLRAGLVTQQRQGRYLVYRADLEAMRTLLAYLTENCCQGHTCAATDAEAACDC